jgi:anti-sigma factor RsiW
LCQHADGALDSTEQGAVSAHLAACPACARDAALQLVVRQALRTHAATLTEAAPASLRARVAAIATAAPPAERATVVPFATWPAQPERRRRWTGFVPMTAAATLLLAFGVGALSPTGTVLAAQLALDHLKCRAIAPITAGADPYEVGRTWERTRGWPVAVPGSRPALHLQFVGLRRCMYHDGTMAHLMYDYRGHRVSLFVMPHAEANAERLAVLGQQTETWTADGRTYAVVADGGAGDLADIAAYFRQAAR